MDLDLDIHGGCQHRMTKQNVHLQSAHLDREMAEHHEQKHDHARPVEPILAVDQDGVHVIPGKDPQSLGKLLFRLRFTQHLSPRGLRLGMVALPMLLQWHSQACAVSSCVRCLAAGRIPQAEHDAKRLSAGDLQTAPAL